MLSRNKPNNKNSGKTIVELSVFQNQNPFPTPGKNTSGGNASHDSPFPVNNPHPSPASLPVLLIPDLDSSLSNDQPTASGVYNPLSIARPSGVSSQMSLLRQDPEFDEPLFRRTQERTRICKGSRRCVFLIGARSILSTILLFGLILVLFQWPFPIRWTRAINSTTSFVISSTNETGNREDMDDDLPKLQIPPLLNNTSATALRPINFPIPDLRSRMHEEFKAILLGPPGGPSIKPDGNASLSQSTKSGTSPSFLPISPVANATVVAEGIAAGTEALLDRQKTEERIHKLGFGEVEAEGNGSEVYNLRDQFYRYSTIPKEEADRIHQLSLIGFSMVRASRIIAKRLNLSKAEAEDGIILDVKAKIEPSAWCTAQNAHTLDRNCNKTEEYRDGNGKCNNFNHPQWGSVLQPYRRILGSDFGDDGISSPRKSVDGVRGLPNAKYISSVMFRDRRLNVSSPLSMLFPMWAEFIERDMTEIVPSSGENNTGIECCEKGKLLEIQHPECFPIVVTPEDDFCNLVGNQTCISVIRSAAAPTCSFGTREQFNLQSAFIDGSTIYGMAGSEQKDGKIGGGNVSNEEMSMSYIWMKHHNGIQEQLAAVNPHWNGHRLFQETRRIVVAEIQHITFNEYLPLLLGNNLILRAGLRLLENGYYEGYDKLVDPGISNVFASTASMFRVSMVSLEQLQDFKSNATIQTNNRSGVSVSLTQNPFLPGGYRNLTMLESQVRDSLFSRSGLSDTSLHPQVTSGVSTGRKSDMAAIVIQRGRDHGIPSYPHWRQLCGLKEIGNFSDLEGIWEHGDIQRAQSVYKSVDDIDLYVGGLTEVHEVNASVGPTFACLLADQFLRIRKGDRFWYEGDTQIRGFTSDQLTSVRSVTLSGILCQVFESIGAIQGQALKGVSDGNLILPCQTLLASSHLNFSAWKEEKPIPGIQFPSIKNGTVSI